jgi:hypothetical protein
METSIIVVICLLLILAFGITAYYFYYYRPNQTNAKRYEIELLGSEITFNEEYNSSLKVSNLVSGRPEFLISNLGYGISLAWEMYIPNLAGNDKWNNKFNIVKPIFTMNDSPQIGYNPKRNYLSIILKYRDNPFRAQYSEIRVDDLKMQTWNKYILVINGRTVNLFINGKLAISKIIPSLPVIYGIESDIELGQINNNFQGRIQNMKLYPFPLSYKEIEMV